ncbi:cation-transporting P-type ATPase [Cereibacter sphaeroides]|uniref:cation-transporting P-type ATPase n=1 Tax=Cereibacter sphaeroides TaxID=1063 RepID=UPI001F41EF1C|nr:cation-transporting P-type ATPase [Cereibacter sphaeroides]MCE6960848.1 cation-transporting P-type ATPase [Cereibacter sphaeroides]MCE6969886.1 cation-transporting P-type ATPase [Cereibacter sphaeroides]MCE6974274.1 cation-transporting P-type ATPase [Cereibacter sphaeroides]
MSAPMLLVDPHSCPAEACLEALDARPEGLTDAEAGDRLARHGPNRLPEARTRGPVRRFLAQFNNVLIYVLLVAALVTGVLQHWVDTGVILAVVLANAVIGFVQEGKAESAMAAIRGMLAPRAAVLRDGRRVAVDGAHLVPGDIVLLEAGDKVPADLRLIEARGLAAQEAILTGESVPVEKTTSAVAADAPLGDRTSMLWSGTLVTQGAARGVVTATGPATEIGRIGSLLAGVEQLTTPLVAQMDHFARWLSFLILLVAALLLLWGFFVGHMVFADLFMIVVAIAVSAIPEGLPAVMTITLAIGVQAMARRNAIVRRLPAIESIGSVSVICTDKTGTLTRNEMMVVAAETPDGAFQVAGEGYAPSGAITPEGDLTRLARAAALCNDAALHDRSGVWSVEGDPMEGALLAFAGKVASDVEAIRLDAIPFDSRHRFMAVLTEGPEGRLIHVKGAPERVLRMCADVDYAHWHGRAEAMARRGLRVLALAERTGDGSRMDAAALEGGLSFLGLVGLIDPPRPEAVAAVAECRAAGIRVKMITGDHAGTAAAIAAQIGLENPHRVLTGTDLDRLDDAQLALEVQGVDVFARTSPEDKLRLVTALQAVGLSVAMTGDGVNDAPALKRADAGIAMGLKGSEAAKEAADLVLADDNFATIAAAVREGRTVYDNLKKVISWTLPTNAGEALVVITALIAGMALPMTAVQILWVNLITGITLGLALAFEPTETGTMARPPRRRDAPILSGELVWHVVLVGSLFLAAVFGMFTYALDRGYPLPLAQTIALNTLVVLEIFHLFFIRNIHGTSLTWAAARGTKVVWIVVIAITSAQFAVTYLPFLQRILGTQAVPVADGLLVVAVGTIFFVIIEIEKQIRLGLTRAGGWTQG